MFAAVLWIIVLVAGAQGAEPAVRLIGGTRDTFGALWIRHPTIVNGTKWFGVELILTPTTAQALCAFAAMAPLPSERRVPYPRALPQFGTATSTRELAGPMFISCPTSASEIGDCTLSGTASTTTRRTGLDCTPFTEFEVRLLNISVNPAVPIDVAANLAREEMTHGLFQMRPQGMPDAPFGSICAASATAWAARAACFRLGLPWTGAYFSEPLVTGSYPSFVFQRSLDCPLRDPPPELESCTDTVSGFAWPTPHSSSPCSPAVLRCINASSWQYAISSSMSDSAISTTLGSIVYNTALTLQRGIGSFVAKPAIADKQWLRTCVTTTDTASAVRLCQLAGFPDASPATVTLIRSWNLQPSLPERDGLAAGAISCATRPLAASSGLSECQLTVAKATSGSCHLGTRANLDCTGALRPGEFRLADPNDWQRPSPSPGNGVPVALIANQTWVPVCDVFNAERALCAAAGFPHVRRPVSIRYGSSEDLQAFDSILCLSRFERDIAKCGGTLNFNAYCAPLLLNCTTQWEFRTTSDPSLGRFEVRPAPTLPWGTACLSTSSAVDAVRACQALGYTNATRTSATRAFLSGASQKSVYMQSIVCSGGSQSQETSLEDCAFTYNDPQRSQQRCSGTDGVNCEQRTWQFRLSPDNSYNETGSSQTPRAGYLQVRYNETSRWSSVCGWDFFRADAVVACRTLGFPNDRPLFDARAGNYTTSNRGLLSTLRCGGTEATLLECDPNIAPALDFVCYDEIVHVDCNALATWQYRIDPSALSAPRDPRFGRLEVRPSAAFAWGTVCTNDFPVAAAALACRSLGYGVDEPVVMPTVRVNQIPVYMSKIACSLGSTGLEDCNYIFTPKNLPHFVCSQNSDVVVDCSPRQWEYRLTPNANVTSAASGGVFEARPNGTSQWGTACYMTSGASAVACRSAGFQARQARRILDSPTAASRDYLRYASCVGVEERIDRCFTSPAYTATATRQCPAGNGVAAIDCTDHKWEFTLTSDSVVMARPTSSTPWAGVCSRSFDAQDAVRLCASLGTPNHRPNFTTTLHLNLSATPLYYISSVACDPAATHLENCTFAFWSAESAPRARRCTEGLVAIDCSVKHWEYRLQSGRIPTLGRVVMRAAGTDGPWSTICVQRMSVENLHVACRSVGIVDAIKPLSLSASAISALGGLSPNPPILRDVNCGGDEVTLDGCDYDFATTQQSSCSSSEVVAVDCTNYKVRLSEEPIASSGGNTSLVVVRRTPSVNPYAYVCFENVAPGVATKLCFFFARNTTVARLTPVTISASRGSYDAVKELNCGLTALDFAACDMNYEEQSSTGCSGQLGAVLDCSAPDIGVRIGDPVSPNVGKLEIRVSTDPLWRPICARSFNAFSAAVGCRSLGLPPQNARVLTVTVSSTLQGYQITCPTGATDIRSCTLALTTIGPSQPCPTAIGLYCEPFSVDAFQGELVGETSPLSGRVMLRAPETGSSSLTISTCFDTERVKFYREVCDGSRTSQTSPQCAIDSFGIDVCKLGGFSEMLTSRIFDGEELLKPNSPINTSTLRLFRILYERNYCSYSAGKACISYDIHLAPSCASLGQYFDAAAECMPKAAWQFRLGRTQNRRRLAPAERRAFSGRLEVRPNRWTPWGTVCSRSFGDIEASGTCGLLGLSTESSSSVSQILGSVYAAPGGRGPVHLTHVACHSILRPGQFERCAYQFPGRCSHLLDVGVNCSLPTVNWTITAVPIDAPTNSIFIAILWDGERSSVVRGGFDSHAAAAMCSGRNGSEARVVYMLQQDVSVRFPDFPAATNPTRLRSPRCIVNTTDLLGDCNFNMLDALDAEVASDDVIPLVSCRSSPQQIAPLEVRLSEGNLVQLRLASSDDWGAVCAAGFSAEEASAMCDAVGTTTPRLQYILLEPATLPSNHQRSAFRVSCGYGNDTLPRLGHCSILNVSGAVFGSDPCQGRFVRMRCATEGSDLGVVERGVGELRASSQVIIVLGCVGIVAIAAVTILLDWLSIHRIERLLT